MEALHYDIKCTTADCQNKAEHYCVCQVPLLYLCTMHMHDQPDHRSSKLFKPISLSDKETIINFCNKCKAKCLDLKNKVLQTCKEYVDKITETTTATINNIRELETLYDTIATLTINSEKVRTHGNLSMHEKIISNQVGNITNDSPFWTIPNLELGVEVNIKKMLLNLLKNLEDESLSAEIAAVKHGTKRISVFNVSTLDNSSRLINCPELLYNNAGWCVLPDGSFFYCCGYSGTHLKSTFVMDLNNRTCNKRKDANVARYQIGTCAYLNGCVYAFGGLNTGNGACNVVEKYDIEKDEWNTLNPMGISIHCNSSVAYEDRIFVGGNAHVQILMFTVNEGKWDVSLNCTVNTYKVLCKAEGKIFAFEGNRLNEFNGAKWETTNTATGLPITYMLAPEKKRAEHIYIYLADNNVYRFSYLLKKIEKVDSFVA